MEKNKETQDRRQFFKEAAKKAIPLFAIAVLGPTLLSSCSKDNSLGTHGCSDCSGSCKTGCSGDCKTGCTDNCDGLCGGDCWAYCESKVKSK